MNKFLCSFLAIIMAVALAACSSGISQEEYDKILNENTELSSKLDSLQKKYDKLEEISKELAEINQGNIEKDLKELEQIGSESKNIAFMSAAHCMDENAECSILNDDLIQITIPMGSKAASEVKDSIQSFAPVIPTALNNSEFKSCLITVVDSSGTVIFGYTIKKDKSLSTFVSDKYLDQ